jgi:hypothetical protein
VKDKKNETEVTVKVNYVNVILFAIFAIMLMYGAVYFIYKGLGEADEKSTEEALANAVLQTTPVVTTTEETTTDPYIYEYLDTFDSAQVSAKSAILYDKTSNKILFEKNPDDRCYPASTTKLVTAIVALENVSPDTVYTVGTEIQLIGENSSTAFLVEGSALTLNDLIYAMLLPSGNDAAYTVAVNTARIVSDNPHDSFSSEPYRYPYEVLWQKGIIGAVLLLISEFHIPFLSSKCCYISDIDAVPAFFCHRYDILTDGHLYDNSWQYHSPDKL